MYQRIKPDSECRTALWDLYSPRILAIMSSDPAQLLSELPLHKVLSGAITRLEAVSVMRVDDLESVIADIRDADGYGLDNHAVALEIWYEALSQTTRMRKAEP